MINDLLSVHNVSKTYTGHKALDGVSLSVPEGTVYGLLGPNGAGKTTLIRIINHITAPDSGHVIFNGHNLTAKDVVNIGYLPEERGLYKKMRVGDQAIFFARLKGLSKNDATKEVKKWFEKFDITSWWGKKVEELSKGMAQKIQFIITVLHNPKLLIFDEPFSGFDPINANLLKEEILTLKNQGSTIIFSTHNMGSVEEICSHITLIDKGKNILTGEVDQLRRQYSDGRYDLFFEGNSDSLKEALSSMVAIGDITTAPRGRNKMEIILHPATKLNEVIDTANKTVSLIGFNESIASMNDIFIRTVGKNIID